MRKPPSCANVPINRTVLGIRAAARRSPARGGERRDADDGQPCFPDRTGNIAPFSTLILKRTEKRGSPFRPPERRLNRKE